MREPGQSFFAFSTSGNIGQSGGLRFGDAISAFVEHGIGPKLTIGADGWASDGDLAIMGFANVPFEFSKSDSWSVGVGLGAYRKKGQAAQPAMRVSVSWGRGFESQAGAGWMQAETSVIRRMRPGLTVLKLDLTVGLAHSDRGKAILQLFTAKEGTGPVTAKLAPSYAFRISQRAEVVVGGTFGVSGDRTRQVSIGTWVSF